MFQHLRHGIDISRHHLKGVYLCVIGKGRNRPTEVICSLREGTRSEWRDDQVEKSSSSWDPITLSHDGQHVTLQPWDPYACIIAAGIINSLVHFPLSRGTRVLAIDAPLQTLSHIADILGVTGRLIGIVSDNNPRKPSAAQITDFLKWHPAITLVTTDVQNASLERYERLLSVPASSKYAFLMAMHPRLGENSPARILGEESHRICKHIFDFLLCGDMGKVKCLVMCDWPEGTQVDSMRNVVLAHVDILQRWTDPDPDKKCDESEDAGATSGHGAKERVKGTRASREETDTAPHWVLLGLPTDNLIAKNQAADVNSKLTEVLECMKRIPSGLRTGLFAKEQLLLRPYFPSHALLVFRYAANRDERMHGISRRKLPARHDNVEPDAENPSSRPPSSGSMPMPSFLGGFGSKLGGLATAPGLSVSPPVQQQPQQQQAGNARETRNKANKSNKSDQADSRSVPGHRAPGHDRDKAPQHIGTAYGGSMPQEQYGREAWPPSAEQPINYMSGGIWGPPQGQRDPSNFMSPILLGPPGLWGGGGSGPLGQLGPPETGLGLDGTDGWHEAPNYTAYGPPGLPPPQSKGKSNYRQAY